MGKLKKKSTAFVHAHTHNPHAHESDERKAKLLQNLEIRRLIKSVEKQRRNLQQFLPDEAREAPIIDPRYELKGAARAAQEHYRPPGYRSPVDPVNLFEKLKHDLWTHPAGNTYLQTMRELGLAYHNIGGKTRDASKIFEEILGLDPDDHQHVKEDLLRCYMNASLGHKARDVISRDLNNCCLSHHQVLLDIISLRLQESGASLQAVHASLDHALSTNGFLVWLLAHRDVFEGVVELADTIDRSSSPPGSIQEAILCFHVDKELWKEEEESMTILQAYLMNHRRLSPPELSEELIDSSNEETVMFLRMFQTGLELIQGRPSPANKSKH